MNFRRRAATAPLAISLLLVGLALSAAPAVRAQEQEVPRRPRGPAAGPVIKLPRGEGAPADEQAQPAEGQRAGQALAPQKWEYCFVVSHTFVKQRDVGLSTRSVPVVVIYFTGTSEEVEGASYDLAIGNALAKLGDDGWELVAVREGFKLSEGTGGSVPVFYLKRPKRQD